MEGIAIIDKKLRKTRRLFYLIYLNNIMFDYNIMHNFWKSSLETTQHKSVTQAYLFGYTASRKKRKSNSWKRKKNTIKVKAIKNLKWNEKLYQPHSYLSVYSSQLVELFESHPSTSTSLSGSQIPFLFCLSTSFLFLT